MIAELTACVHSDTPEIARIRRSIEEAMAAAGSTQWPVGSLPEERIAELVDAGEFFALRTPGGDLAATIRILDADPAIWGADAEEAVYLHTLMTNPAYSGQGLGSKLLTLMDDVARRRGVTHVRLDCVPTLVPFYERHGFTDTGEIHHGNHSTTTHAHLLDHVVPAKRHTASEVIAPLGVSFTPPKEREQPAQPEQPDQK